MTDTVREATSRDAEALVGLIRPAFKEVADRFGLTPGSSPRHPSNCTVEWVKTEIADGVRYFILEEDGKPVGCVGIDPANPQTFYIQRLAVLPELQKKGYGSVLMEYAIGVAKEMDAPRVATGILSDNFELKSWYRQRGFAVTNIKRLPHLPFEVTFMAMEL